MQVLMKWSLHPEVGPRLRSGQPLLQQGDLPEVLQVAETTNIADLVAKCI